MRVKRLIELLQQEDPEAWVLFENKAYSSDPASVNDLEVSQAGGVKYVTLNNDITNWN